MIKLIEIHAKSTYPIISVYEFEYLKSDDTVRMILKPCSIYMIVQRPLTYFTKFRVEGEQLCFNITDESSSSQLECIFNPSENGYQAPGESIEVDIKFYREQDSATPPFDEVAGFKLYGPNGEFRLWMTPQKLIHHVMTNRMKVGITGSIEKYVNYRVLYIGQAFNQDVWKRLTGHERLQSILTTTETIGSNATLPAHEVSLILLDITHYSDIAAIIHPELCGELLGTVIEPISHDLDSADAFVTPLTNDAPELTNEVEALLINKFKPKHNQVLFDKYPDILKGTKTVGYSASTLVINQLYAVLSTESYQLDCIPNGIVSALKSQVT